MTTVGPLGWMRTAALAWGASGISFEEVWAGAEAAKAKASAGTSKAQLIFILHLRVNHVAGGGPADKFACILMLGVCGSSYQAQETVWLQLCAGEDKLKVVGSDGFCHGFA